MGPACLDVLTTSSPKKRLCNGTWATDDNCISIDIAGNGWGRGGVSPKRQVHVDGGANQHGPRAH